MDSNEAASLWESNAETWTRHVRAGYDVYRDALNTPAFLAILPAVAGLDGLDIGCGEGSNTRKLAQFGARMTGIDIAPTFIRHAQATEEAESLGIRYQAGDGLNLPFGDASFDFAVALMSLMDMPEPARALREAARVLRPGGFVQFSILHPCFCPPHRRPLRDTEGHTTAIEVGRYFESTNGEIETWHFTSLPAEDRERVPPFRIPRFHHTLSEWMSFVLGAGLMIEQLAEPRASQEAAELFPVVEDTRVAPLFLHVRARKAGSGC